MAEHWEWLYDEDNESVVSSAQWFVNKDPKVFEWCTMNEDCQQELESRFQEDPKSWIDIQMNDMKFVLKLDSMVGHIDKGSKTKAVCNNQGGKKKYSDVIYIRR